MWEFLSNVLEKAGVVAALYVLTLIGMAIAARYTAKAYKAALDRVAEVQKAEEKKRGDMRAAFEIEKRELMTAHAAELARERDECSTELLAVAEQRRAEAERFGVRLDTVRDHHTDQMVTVVEKSTRHIERIDQTVGRLAAGLDMLIRIGEGRG